MVPEADPVKLIGRAPDERLLGEDLATLPVSGGEPAPLAPVGARGAIVAAGATLTAISLLAGVVLAVVGIASGIDGSFDTPAVVELAIGVLLVATHWGWVHVAEFTAGGVERHGNRDAIARRQRWLRAIEPYTRFSVRTESASDGSITILTLRHQPIASDERSFTFTRETVSSEIHSGDEDAAAVTERAELLRRQAAAATARERERFEAVRDEIELTALARESDEQQIAATRAGSRALSEQINANLKDGPLDG